MYIQKHLCRHICICTPITGTDTWYGRMAGLLVSYHPFTDKKSSSLHYNGPVQ